MDLSRRTVLGSSLALLAGGVAITPANAQQAAYGAALTGSGVTGALARFLAGIRYEDLPPAAVHEAKRAVLDWIGCALAGSTHPTVDVMLATLEALGSVPAATVLGRRGLRLGLLDAPVANGQMGHVLDFDDTHLGGVILHTSTATLPALFALGEWRKSSGRDVIVALAAAFEAGIRVGQAATSHHLGGWHLTGTLGHRGRGCRIGAADRARREADDLRARHRVHAGRGHAAEPRQRLQVAARRQVRLSRRAGLDARVQGVRQLAGDSRRQPGLHQGLQRDAAERRDHRRPGPDVDDHRQRLQAVRLRRGPASAHRRDDRRVTPIAQPATEVARVEVLVHPDVIRITGIDTPNSGLMSKFSANHAAAVAYIDQAAGVAQFTNERSADAGVQALRRVIEIRPEPSFRLDQAAATVRTRSGATYDAQMAHATGTVSNPMSDQRSGRNISAMPRR